MKVLVEVILVVEVDDENLVLRIAGAHQVIAALFTLSRFSRMEPELSITMPIATGMSSWRND